jgi:hypothetical protein
VGLPRLNDSQNNKNPAGFTNVSIAQISPMHLSLQNISESGVILLAPLHRKMQFTYLLISAWNTVLLVK